MIRRLQWVVIAAAFVLILVAPAALAGSRKVALARSVLQRINAVRREHGLAPLVFSSRLAAAALQHSEEMGAGGYFAHQSVDHSAFWKRLARWYPPTGRRYWTVGENLLWSSPDLSPSATVRIWMHSPEHRANLLRRSWHQIGLAAVHFDSAPGLFHGRPVTLITADFGARSAP